MTLQELRKKNCRKLENCAKCLRENCEQLNGIFQQVSAKRDLMTKVWSTDLANLKIKASNQLIRDFETVKNTMSSATQKPELVMSKISSTPVKATPNIVNESFNALPLDASELFRNFKKTESQKSVETSFAFSEIPKKNPQNEGKKLSLKTEFKMIPDEFKFPKTNKFQRLKESVEVDNTDYAKVPLDLPYVDSFLTLDDYESADLTTKDSPPVASSNFKGLAFLSSRNLSTGNSLIQIKSQNQNQPVNQVRHSFRTNPFEEDALKEKGVLADKILTDTANGQKTVLQNEEGGEFGTKKWGKLNWNGN